MALRNDLPKRPPAPVVRIPTPSLERSSKYTAAAAEDLGFLAG